MTGISPGAFRVIKAAAKKRGIEFMFTYDEWRTWWEDALKDHPGAKRGTGRDDLSMCRIGDQGPYAAWNVYPGTPAENRKYGGPPRKGYVSWLRGTTGANHPRSKPVKTRSGEFPSVKAAAEHFGISRTEIRRRLAAGTL